MYIRKRRRQVSEINVVPYIDVMLVLLIIFMVTAPLISQGVKVDLPQAQAEALPEESQQPLVASVNVNGEYFINIGESQEEPLNGVDLATLVAAHLQKQANTPVMVKADGAVSYDAVIQLMVLLQKAGVPSVGLMTDPAQDNQ